MDSSSIKSLTPRHLKIVDLAIKGWPPGKIAKHLEMSVSMVSVIMHSPHWGHEFAIRRAIHEERDDNKAIKDEDEVTKMLREGAVRAAEKLVNHIDSLDDGISVRSAAEVLDRSGYGKKGEDKTMVLAPTVIINEADGKKLVESVELVQD